MSKRYDILYNHFRRYLKNLLRNYFIWEVPETIDPRALEEYLLFENGFCVGFNWNESKDPTYKGKTIVAGGALPGIDLYGRATKYVSANPVRAIIHGITAWEKRATRSSIPTPSSSRIKPYPCVRVSSIPA